MKRKGFSLAEVLITLGVIGVIAAITIPTLINKFQKQVLVNQLKKSYTTLEQGFQKMLADEGVDKLSDIPAWNKVITTYEYEDFDEYIKKYFNIVEKSKAGHDYTQYFLKSDGRKDSYGDLLDEDVYYKFPDGMWIDVTVDLISDDDVARIAIDTNGLKEPNTYGRDVFYFVLNNNGKFKIENPDSCPPNSGAGSCFARIIQNGWVMDY